MLKKVLVLVVVGFVVYYLLTAPGAAADATRGAGEAVMNAFGQIGTFIDELLQ